MAARIASPFKTPAERAAERETKREAVIRAAVRMFNERGFYSCTFDDVAASLGVSKATVYHYLGNKEEVLIECMTRGHAGLCEAANRAAAGPGNGADRLRAFLIQYALSNMDDFGRCAIRTPEEGLSPECAARLNICKREIDGALRDMVRAAIADGSIPDCDVRLVTSTVIGALNWPARWFNAANDDENSQIAAEMVDLLFRGFAGN
ncbi:MAG: TetR family transcriptional regulator [Alphaproteobacteria bacterium HGW-Alphaproteobacteria-5]|jgi:AcrR family transcriptional regulator|nr:MAG: TetR family transcriptional regulator [Alphaproteobacteria bacterium HGW-Alphaproteobacteria-5]